MVELVSDTCQRDANLFGARRGLGGEIEDAGRLIRWRHSRVTFILNFDRNLKSGIRTKRAETDMTNDNTATTDLNYADKLWKSADTLRGQVDAAEYKHVVLGLLFLKYISDSFEARRDELRGELETEGIGGPQLERLLESRDEYTADRVFWVPPESALGQPAKPGDAPGHCHPHRRRNPRRRA